MAHAFRKTHYHKIEKSHQAPLPAPAKWKNKLFSSPTRPNKSDGYARQLPGDRRGLCAKD